jgi:hypothetical protein
MSFEGEGDDESKALSRKSFFVKPKTLRRARRAMGVATDAEAVRMALEWAASSEEHWRLLRKSAGKLKRGSFRQP